MNLSQMVEAISRRVDDVVNINDAVEWLNSGKNHLAMAVNAKFPDLVSTNGNSQFVFDEMYHEAPVLYACASFKEQDSSLNEVNNFMVKFEQIKQEFVKNYEVPPEYRNDRLSQQFEVINGVNTFTITKDGYNPQFGDLKVYVNNILTNNFLLDGLTFTVSPATDGDKVTAVWEEHTDLIDPPFNWWGW